jgi:hypothetical protein
MLTSFIVLIVEFVALECEGGVWVVDSAHKVPQNVESIVKVTLDG